MKKGFTIIEVVLALMVFCIFFVSIIGLDSAIMNTFCKSKVRDNEYNIARAICEKFESENGVVAYKKVVLYMDGVEDMNQSIADTLKFSIEPENVNYNTLKANNLQNKQYATIINCYNSEFLYFIEVNTFSMTHTGSGVKLRIARDKHKNET